MIKINTQWRQPSDFRQKKNNNRGTAMRQTFSFAILKLKKNVNSTYNKNEATDKKKYGRK